MHCLIGLSRIAWDSYPRCLPAAVVSEGATLSDPLVPLSKSAKQHRGQHCTACVWSAQMAHIASNMPYINTNMYE